MKRILCLLLAMVLVLSLAACGETPDDGSAIKDRPENAKRGNQIGDLAYGATLTEIDQNGYTDHIFDPTRQGKITVINFWAYWCPPCVNELPHFAQVAKDMADTVAVIAVHCDAVENAQTFIAANYPDSAIRFAMDKTNHPSAYYSALGGSGSIPYTVILDADGIIRKTFVGAISHDTLVAAIQECDG